MSSLIVEVCKVEEVTKHPNADRLSVARIKGWNVIVGLDQYKVGDLVVYCPPDSIIPQDLIEKHNLEYLRSNGRVRPVKLRSFISQGLILDVPEGKYKAGDNVAEVLGITKYEPPEIISPKSGRQLSPKKYNIWFDKYTDIENINNFPNIFQEGDEVLITEKIHGTNFRAGNLEMSPDESNPLVYRIIQWIKRHIFRQTHEFCVGSHNVQLYYGHQNNYYEKNVYGKIADKYSLKNKVRKDHILYGEIYGEGIQDLTYGIKGISLVVFDIRDSKAGWFLPTVQVVTFCRENNLQYVPILFRGKWENGLDKLCNTGDSALTRTPQMREGCVIRALPETYHPEIGRKILKSINPEYLIREKGTEFK